MTPRVLERLVHSGRLGRITPESLPALLGRGDAQLLLFTGDPAAPEELDDIAVVVRELLDATRGRLAAGVVERAAESELAARFGVPAFPALVFVRDGRATRVVTHLQGWGVYQDAAAVALEPDLVSP